MSLVPVVLLAVAATASSAAPQTATPALPLNREQVVGDLNEAVAWYHDARIVMRALDAAGAVVFGRNDQQTAIRALQTAFDAATAEAGLVADQDTTGSNPGGQRRDARAELQAAISHDEEVVKQIEARVRGTSTRRKVELAREAAAARNQLELDQARLDFMTKLAESAATLTNNQPDLAHQIQMLRDGLPELKGQPISGPETATGHGDVPSGAWGTLRRLLALQRSRSSLDDLMDSTNALARTVDREVATVRSSVRPIVAQLRAVAQAPTANGMTLADGERQFQTLLGRAKQLGNVLLPLDQESALVHRYAADLQGWRQVVDRQSVQLLQTLGIELVGVVIALLVILAGSVVWRVAVVRYVDDAYRRRLLLTTRTVVVVGAIVLVIVFHFTTELAALVTALGFAAAGIAFALQNVILAIAGYFSIMAPNGIRVGDRVSLQGPFGYVHGEVADIGVLRIKLNELAGTPLAPTGRVVVFPNSVVFTGSFFKDPAGSGHA